MTTETNNSIYLTRTEDVFARSLPVTLTEEEQVEFGKLLAHEHSEAQATEDELTAIKQDFKSRAASHLNRINHLAKCINAGHEYRNVDCRRQYFTSTREVAVIRLDTGEEVERRPMTPSEYQTQMEL